MKDFPRLGYACDRMAAVSSTGIVLLVAGLAALQTQTVPEQLHFSAEDDRVTHPIVLPAPVVRSPRQDEGVRTLITDEQRAATARAMVFCVPQFTFAAQVRQMLWSSERAGCRVPA
jgi:hypothetical protein